MRAHVSNSRIRSQVTSDRDIPLGFGQTGRPPVLVMVAGYSRVITARMLPLRLAADLVSGHWDLLFGWNAVPRALVWDNEAAIGRRREGRVVLGREFAALAGLLACKVILCRPRRRPGPGPPPYAADQLPPRPYRRPAWLLAHG
ncbi:hypothetical protein ACFXPY_38050 [Streptomyces sp. NPDC059153]|uniref:hypothetical protein n=1 Tax=Streptomyces sp. NPDC059153 TaxID=3346743 RepID=UPI00367A94E9